MAIYFDTGVSCASCNAPVVRPTDASEPRPTCQCSDQRPRAADRHDEAQMGSWRDGLAIGATLIGLVMVALSLHGCGAPRGHVLPPPAGCTYAPLPLRVQIDPDAALDSPAFFAAAEAWTRALGRGKPAAVFVAIDPDVVVKTMSADELRALWEAHKKPGEEPPSGAHRRVVVVTSCVPGETRARSLLALDETLDAVAIHDFAVHGFGHALGVAHSTNLQSVMQGTLETGLLAGEPGPDEELPPSYRVTESDALAVLAQKRWRP